ncbi:MAG: transcription factor S [Methanobrevibacter sp.]|jgi:DNA-directed RNA polymerase subunit M|nr:transcription factor S [Methanobrevibacter sp.]
MEFCPECGAMLLPKDNKVKCNCGYEKDLSNEETDQYSVSEKVESNGNIVMKGEEISTLPTTNTLCPKCGNKKAYWWLKQTRSADESETQFFRCTECKHTWRGYD